MLISVITSTIIAECSMSLSLSRQGGSLSASTLSLARTSFETMSECQLHFLHLSPRRPNSLNLETFSFIKFQLGHGRDWVHTHTHTVGCCRAPRMRRRDKETLWTKRRGKCPNKANSCEVHSKVLLSIINYRAHTHTHTVPVCVRDLRSSAMRLN